MRYRHIILKSVLSLSLLLIVIYILPGCPPITPPAPPSQTCNPSNCPSPNACVNNVCTSSTCGQLGSVCCPGGSCSVGSCDPFGLCRPDCGSENQRCCPGRTCNSGTCNASGICTSSCGQLGESCCNGNCQTGTCTEQNICQCAAPVACGSCGGTTQCNGSCSRPTPSDFGQIRNYASPYEESFSCCWIDYTKTFGGSCRPGWKYEGVDVTKISGGGTCEVVSEGSGDSCQVTLRFHNNGLEGARCRILIREKRACDP